MFEIKSVLWIMLFTGIVVHMMCSSNLNIAITHMVKPESVSANKTFVPVCIINSTRDPIEGKKSPPDLIQGEFKWDHIKKNMLMSSASWFMGVAQLIGGVLCQKYGGKIVFGLSNLVMGLLSCLIPFTASVGIEAVIIVRIVQGIAGGVAVGNATKYLISKWIPSQDRAKFVATMAGLYFGNAFSYFMNGYILYYMGWRYIFYVSGLFAIFWYIVWQQVVFDSPQKHPRISQKELTIIENSIGRSVCQKKLRVPWFAILTSVPVAVNTLCYFSSMWTMFTFSMYIPTYLTQIHGYPAHKMGELSSLPYLLETAFAIIFALLTDHILKRKILPLQFTRKFAAFFSTILASIMFFILTYGGCNTVFIMTVLTLAVMCSGAQLSGVSPNVIDLSPNFCAVIHGFQGLICTSSGYMSPLVVAYLTRNNQTVAAWNKVFLVTSVINFVAGLFFLIFGKTDVQSWNYGQEQDKKQNSDSVKYDKTPENDHTVVVHAFNTPT